MKGHISRRLVTSRWGFIMGEDGNEYFVHENDFGQLRRCAKDSKLEFDVAEHDGKKCAVNVVKLSHGSRHPFLPIIQDLEGLLMKYVPDGSDAKRYAKRDFEMLCRYFAVIEDAQIYQNVRYEFRDKYKVESNERTE